jgi:hypothetical protein
MLPSRVGLSELKMYSPTMFHISGGNRNQTIFKLSHDLFKASGRANFGDDLSLNSLLAVMVFLWASCWAHAGLSGALHTNVSGTRTQSQ